ncbi:MAG: hypothetical protein IH609_05585 [Dehalococcoidia bacterium]|nr:hypothetical protein [Dehalococcoidia bacterium]
MDFIVVKRRHSWVVGQSRRKGDHVFDEVGEYRTLGAAEASITTLRAARPQSVALTFDDPRPRRRMFEVVESDGRPED